MNALTITLIIIAIPIAIILITALFTAKEYTLEKDIMIKAPKQEIFNYIRLMKNQEQYSKWVMADPYMKKDFRGTDGTIGCVYAWSSDNKQVGKGEQEIKNIKEEGTIEYEIRFAEPFTGVAQTYMAVKSVHENETRVIWTFHSPLNYPMRIMHLLVNFKKLLGKDLEESLNNLKGILEKKQVPVS